MYTARVSKTDPHAFPSFRSVLRDARYAGTDLYLHVEPGRYTEHYFLEVSTRVMIVPVAGPGTVEISASTADSVFVVTGERGALELYGIHVRGAQDAPGSPTIRADQGTRFKAVDSVFTSGAEVEVSGDGTEVVNCRFDGCGLYWKRGTGGFVRDTVFRGASLYFWRAVNPTVSSVRFSDYDRGGLVAYETSVMVTDCVMSDFGRADGAAVLVKEGSDARFTGLSISGSPGYAISVLGEGTRAAFTDLDLTGWADEGYGVGVGLGAEAAFTSCRIDGSGSSSGSRAVVVARGTLNAEDLTVENVRSHGVHVQEGRFSGRRLAFGQLGASAVSGAGSRFELSDVEFHGTLPGPDSLGGGFFMSDSRLEADGIRASDLNDVVVLNRGSRATLTSLTAERVNMVVSAHQDSTVRVHGAEATGTRGHVFGARTGASVEVVDALVSDSRNQAAYADGAAITLTSVTVSGSAGPGAVVLKDGELTLVDTVIRDGHDAGVRVLDARSRATLARSRVTGNARGGVRVHPDAVVETRDTLLRDNGGEDWAYLPVEGD
ncbi:right-handed parallel beta-helix repeat-containing protein [Nocardiopsis terrae]